MTNTMKAMVAKGYGSPEVYELKEVSKRSKQYTIAFIAGMSKQSFVQWFTVFP